jgi:uncharacterized protein YndB with AHSA1/START domain
MAAQKAAPAGRPTEDTASREIVITRLLDAPRELVFKAWTDPAHVGAWWGPRGFRTTTKSIDIRPGGSWIFTMHGPDGTDYPNRVVYKEIVAPERLVYDHAGEESTEDVRFHSTVTFEDEGGRTRITMRSLFKTREERDLVVEKYGAIEGGEQHLERLGEYVAHQSPHTFVISRTFDAPRALVFKLWTEGEHIGKWFGPKGFKVTLLKADMKPGGIMHTHMQGPNGIELWGKWVIREILPPVRMVFVNCFSDANEGLGRHPMSPEWPQKTLTNIAFEEAAGRTTITIQWTPIEETAAERALFAANHDSMRGGWGGTFDQLAAYLATLAGRA